MLSKMTHEQFDEWCAKDLVEPIGTQKAVCDILAKIGQQIAAFMGIELDESHFMPWLKTRPSEQQTLTPKQSRVALQSHLQMIASK